MVEKMRSPESTDSSSDRERLACDLDLPVFEEPQVEPWPVKMSWSQALRHLARTHGQHRRERDSPERRLREKNQSPFVLS